MILLDTCVIVRSKIENDMWHQEVTERLVAFATNGKPLVICPQVVYEFYVVATRPEAQNGLGYSNSEANEEVENLLNTYHYLNDGEAIFENWRALVKQYSVMGKPVHDARIVAYMQAHNITQLYTLNQQDFERYTDIIQLI